MNRSFLILFLVAATLVSVPAFGREFCTGDNCAPDVMALHFDTPDGPTEKTNLNVGDTFTIWVVVRNVVGADHLEPQLVPLAAAGGYDVTVVDPRRAWASGERFPGTALITDWPDEAMQALSPDHRTAVVTLTHDPKLDDPALAAAVSSPAFYIGALGSRRTQERRLERLRSQGFDAAALARIHGPVGLAIGAKSPAEIAIAILAQIIQVRCAPTAPTPAGAGP